MKKRFLALLLALVMVVALLPTIALAADSGNTLQFSTDLRAEYSATQSQWGSYNVSIAVGTYTPAGGEAKELPAGTTIKYQWYWNTTGKIDPSVDTKMNGGTRAIISTSQAGIKYYYAIATAEIDGVTYTGTTTLAKFIVRVADITVTAAVNNQGLLAACKDGTPACGISVKVADLNMDGKHTYDEAMVALHKTWKSEADFAVSDAGEVTKLWGVETKNCLFYLNDKTFDTKVTETTLKKGDRLVASLIKDTTNFSDKYTTFDLAQKTIAEGVAFDLVLKDGDGNALPGVQIGLWEEGAFKALEGKTTDEEGKVSLSFETAGKYYVTASGSVQGSPIVAPGCAVTVKKVGELRIDGKLGTNPYTSLVGEAPSFRSQFTPRYYEGSSWTSATKITRKWTASAPTARCRKRSLISMPN